MKLTQEEKECLWCKKKFYRPKMAWIKNFCSGKCRAHYWREHNPNKIVLENIRRKLRQELKPKHIREPRKIICKQCQKEVISNNKIFCSLRCYNEYGKIHRLYESPRERNRTIRLMKVSNGNLICSRCGCNNVRILEINHINGDGNKERKNQPHDKLYKDILSGKRTIKDLNLLCRLCNQAHFVKLRYGIDFEIKCKS